MYTNNLKEAFPDRPAFDNKTERNALLNAAVELGDKFTHDLYENGLHFLAKDLYRRISTAKKIPDAFDKDAALSLIEGIYLRWRFDLKEIGKTRPTYVPTPDTY